MVAAEHDQTGANLRHQVTQRLGGEHQCVEVELVQIFGRLPFQLDVRVAILRRDEAGVVGAPRAKKKKPWGWGAAQPGLSTGRRSSGGLGANGQP